MIAPVSQQVQSAGEARNRFDELTARLAACQSRQREAAEDLRRIIAALIDAPHENRPDLIAQHAEASAVRAALVDEVAELRRQLAASYVLYYRRLELAAEAAYEQAKEAASRARVEYNTLLDQRTQHYNIGFRTASSEAYTQRARELEAEIGRLKVDSLAAAQAQDIASNELERARGMTARAVRAVEENKALAIMD